MWTGMPLYSAFVATPHDNRNCILSETFATHKTYLRRNRGALADLKAGDR